MNLNFVKKGYEMMPEWVKYALATPVHRKLVANATFLEQYGELVEAEQKSADELLDIQLKRLRMLCLYCYEESGFYRERFKEAGVDPVTLSFDGYSTLPVLSKEDVLANYDDICLKSVKGGSYCSTTGGSSGRRLVVVNSDECLYRENAFIMHYYSKYGFNYKRSRLAYFGGDGDSLVTFSPLYNTIRCNTKLLSSDNVVQAVKQIDSFKPDFLRGIPSCLSYFSQLCIQKGCRLSQEPKGIFLQSENVYSDQLRHLKQLCDVPVAAYYGSTERVAFGSQISWDEDNPVYTFHKLYGLTEFDSESHIVGTGFINKKMPLLRYVIDDTVESVGLGYTVLGHRREPIIGSKGEHISTASLCDMDESTNCLLSFQFVQYTAGELLMDYVSTGDLSVSQKAAICTCVEKKCMGAVKVRLRRVPELKLTDRGKRTLLIQHIPNETISKPEETLL